MNVKVRRLLRVARNVADLDRAIAFYCDALGFHVDDAAHDIVPAWAMEPRSPRAARLLLGNQQLDLTEFAGAAPYPQGASSADIGFQHCAIVVADMQKASRRVIQKGATPISRDGPQTLPPSTGSVTAFKFRDPDGHPLELIYFPAGTGDPAWQRAPVDPKRPALGIDHSAISVADVERSIAFYESLGMHVLARGVNRGAQQQRLDDLDDVEVGVVALAPGRARTPHLELLGYLRPRGHAPADHAVRDIASDRLVLRLQNLHAAATSLSPVEVNPAVHAAARSTDDRPTILLRDPDGYWLELV